VRFFVDAYRQRHGRDPTFTDVLNGLGRARRRRSTCGRLWLERRCEDTAPAPSSALRYPVEMARAERRARRNATVGRAIPASAFFSALKGFQFDNWKETSRCAHCAVGGVRGLGRHVTQTAQS